MIPTGGPVGPVSDFGVRPGNEKGTFYFFVGLCCEPLRDQGSAVGNIFLEGSEVLGTFSPLLC